MGITRLVEIGKEDLVCRLVENASNAEDENRPCVGEHPSHQPSIETRCEAAQLLPEAECDRSCAGQVDIEGVAHLCTAENDVVEEVECDVEYDEKQFERGKLDGPLLIAQVGEGNALECIESHRCCHHPDVAGVVSIPHEGTNRVDECQHEQYEDRTGRRHHP